MIALVLFALAMVLFGGMLTRKVRAMRRWPQTAGRIVRAEVATTAQRHARSRRRDYRVMMYVPRVVYAYEVDGDQFEGDDIGWMVSRNSRPAAARRVGRYPLQMPMQVSYDPEDPKQSTIAPPGAALAAGPWLIAALLALAAYAVGWL